MQQKDLDTKNFQFPIGLSTIVVGVSGLLYQCKHNSTGGTITMDGSNGFIDLLHQVLLCRGFDQNVEYLVVGGGGGGENKAAEAVQEVYVTGLIFLLLHQHSDCYNRWWRCGGENSGDSRGGSGTNSVLCSPIQSHGGGGGGSGNTLNGYNEW